MIDFNTWIKRELAEKQAQPFSYLDSSSSAVVARWHKSILLAVYWEFVAILRLYANSGDGWAGWETTIGWVISWVTIPVLIFIAPYPLARERYLRAVKPFKAKYEEALIKSQL